LPDRIHVIGQHRIIDVVRVAEDLARDPVTQAPLGSGVVVLACCACGAETTAPASSMPAKTRCTRRKAAGLVPVWRMGFKEGMDV
jgi:hypothetical protein